MFVKIVILVMVLLCSTVILGITFNCDTQKAQKGSDVTCTCTSSNNIEWQLNDIFFSTCTTTNICSPKPIGYIFQNDVSQTDKNYGLTVQSFDYSSCAEYSCTDTSTSEEKKIEISISDFDVSSVVASEPGANTNGSINVTTGCVFPPEDISVKWYKVKQNGNVEEIKANIPIPIFDRATCSRTCNSKEDKILTNGFTHTEYTNTDGVKVRYRVVLRLIPFPDLGDLFTWTTSSEYRLKAATSTSTTTTTTPATTTSTASTSRTSASTTTTKPASSSTTSASTTTTKPASSSRTSASTTTTKPASTSRTSASTTTTKPTTKTTTKPTTTTMTTPTTSTATPATTITTTPVTTPSTSSLSDKMIIVIVVVPVGVIALVGTVIFSCLYYRLRRGKRKPASHERHKHGRHYKGNMIPVQQHQQQPYIMYSTGHTGEPTHKETKKSRSLHIDDRYNLYNGYHWGCRVKQNPVYMGDRNLSRLYYNDSLPRYDDYWSGYTRGHVYQLNTSGYHYRSDYHGDSRRHGNRQHSQYPIYSIQQEYIDPSYSYMGY